jgi:hypothetical protein
MGAFCAWNEAADKAPSPTAMTADMICYESPGGETVFSLSLELPPGDDHSVHDHVVMVDTSASQAGSFREQSLDLVESLLESLPDDDRVQLVAVDTGVVELSDEFVSPHSPEINEALRKLRRRVPLGATTLLPALEEAAGNLDSDHDKSIIYIGDAMSAGGLIDPGKLRPFLTELRERHIAVHSYCVGPRTDLQLAGLLAVHTGGIVLVDELIDDAEQPIDKLGEHLAEAVDATIVYPDQVRFESSSADFLPALLPPLRDDRETIILGKGRTDMLEDVVVEAGGETLKWTVRQPENQAGSSYLVALWAMAERSEGLFVSVAGSELLGVARQEYEQNLAQLVDQGERAIAARDLRQAEEIARTIREFDPANVEAETILNASQKVKAVQTHLAHLEKAAPSPAPAADGATVNDSDLTEIYKEAMRVRTERLTKEVNQTIEAARKTAGDDPDAAIGGLKRVLNTVTSSADIDPVDRETLRHRTQNAIDEIAIEKQKFDLNRLEAQRRRSAVQARQFASDELIQREEELEQLIEKVRSLLSEGFAGNEAAFERAEAVARAAWEKAPYIGVTAAAVFDSEAAGQLDKIERLRYLRADKFLEALGMVEKAHVPFPDEPPIVWPAPEVWRDLTARRKKWASVDLMQYNKAEIKIRGTLEKPTEVNFNEQPLEEAIRYLAEYHGIDIWIDKTALLDEGTALDQPVTLQLSGATFRSTLKLLLEPLNLTWLIEDEVMKITTTVKASEKLSTRVYPVADLVIPIRTMRGGMMGGMRGGMGMMGGGMGMMGGGMGGGMMGGMGMMSVPSEAFILPGGSHGADAPDLD